MDFVLPFVTSDDPLWREQIAKYNPIIDQARYRDFGTLKYLFRGVDRFMPFIDRIVLVVSGPSQIPDWVNTDTVRIVLHEEIMPEKILPTFNSSVIECFINNIPDLSERFVYGNDDMFPLAPMTEGCFFRGVRPVVNYAIMTDTRTPFLRLCKNTSDLARELAGDSETIPSGAFYKPTHFFSAMLRDVNRSVVRVGEDRIMETVSRFRRDKNCNQYLYQDYYVATGLSVHAPFAYTAKRVLLSKEEQVPEIVHDIRRRRYQMYCINDEYGGNRSEEISTAIISAFEEILPDKSRYEK